MSVLVLDFTVELSNDVEQSYSNNCYFPTSKIIIMAERENIFSALMCPETRALLDIDPEPWVCPDCKERFASAESLSGHWFKKRGLGKGHDGDMKITQPLPRRGMRVKKEVTFYNICNLLDDSMCVRLSPPKK